MFKQILFAVFLAAAAFFAYEYKTHSENAPALHHPDVIYAQVNPGVNAFLLRIPNSKKVILIDTGSPGDEAKILGHLEQNGYSLEDVALIILTHGHIDHAGSVQHLLSKAQIPVSAHPAEAPFLQNGTMLKPKAYSLLAKAMHLAMSYIPPKLPMFTPTVLFKGGESLKEYGIDGKILHTPGHSDGSVSIVLDNGHAIVGDLLSSSFFFVNKVSWPMFYTNFRQIRKSIEKLLNTDAQVFHVGHGLAFSREALEKFMRQNPLNPVDD